MDGLFELLLPAQIDLRSMGFDLPVFEQQGSLDPQGLLERRFGKDYRLRQVEIKNFSYVMNLLPTKLRQIEWVLIEVEGPDMFFGKSRGISEEENSFSFSNLLKFLLEDRSVWVAIFEARYDSIGIVKPGNIQDILRICKDNNAIRNGFMIFSM